MQATTLSFSNIHKHGELFGNIFRARHDVFVARNKWSLTNADGMEYDQYDTPASRWIAIHDDNKKVMAGGAANPDHREKRGLFLYDPRCAVWPARQYP